jgi:hypothetical protein
MDRSTSADAPRRKRDLSQTHVVLYAIGHPLKDDEKAVELTAMILGFQNFIGAAENVTKEGAGLASLATLFLLPLGFLFVPGSRTRKERLGYLTSDEAYFARGYLHELQKLKRIYL